MSTRPPSTQDMWGAVMDDSFGKSPLGVRILKDGHLVKAVRLESEVTYIGRMPENHIVLDDGRVSRSHARIFSKDAKFFVEDQQSENGIHVNGKKATREEIKAGDQIKIGNHVLEVVSATAEMKTAVREDQLDQAEEEEWRQDQTVSVSSQEVQAIHLAKMKAKQAAAASAPSLDFVLRQGTTTFQKKVQLDFMQDTKGEDGSVLEVRVRLGKSIYGKKIPL